jgi:4-amino-4-deoxy-L-arabinose transferase-like glycosyltransferase
MREGWTADDWAYALTVRHLLATGEYRLHDWAAANMPVQIFWGALFVNLFGYSATVLRCSTLFLLFIGLFSLYRLLRDFGIKDTEAGMLTLAVFSSPIVLFLSFTFQTDVQFLGWLTLSLWLYTRAQHHQSYVLMVLASAAAFASIGTRQFGLALAAGLLMTWLLFEQDRLRKVPLYLTGLVLPMLIILWQVSFGANRPTFTQKVRLAEQLAYMQDLPCLVTEILWRPTILLQYLVLFLLPLLPLLIVFVRSAWVKRYQERDGQISSRNGGSASSLWLLVAWGIYIIAGVSYGYFFYGRFYRQMPTEMWWTVQNILHLPGVLIPSLPWVLPYLLLIPILASLLGTTLPLRAMMILVAAWSL